MIHTPHSARQMFQIGKGCQWKGAVVLHSRNSCNDCTGLPGHYAQVWPDGTMFNEYIVAIPRANYVVKSMADVIMFMRFKFLIACRKCEKHFKSESGAYSHCVNYHGYTDAEGLEPFDKVIKENANVT